MLDTINEPYKFSMRLIAVYIVAIMFFCAGCANKSGTKEQCVEYVSEFPYETTISEYETLPFDLLNPEQIFVSPKYIAILERHEPKMMKIYDRRTYEYISSFLSVGRGPDEVLLMNRLGQIDLTDENIKIKVQDFALFVAWLDVGSSIRENRTVFTNKVEFGGKQTPSNLMYAANGVYYLTDDKRLLMFIDPERSDNKHISSSPFSVVYDLETQSLSDTIYWYSPKTDQLSILFAHSASMSPDRKYLCRANRYINSIIIGDLEASRIKTICFDETAMDLEKAARERKNHFSELSVDDNYLFAVKNYDFTQRPAEIYVIDWQGDPVAKITIPFKVRSLFVADLNEIYAITEDDEIVKFEYFF